MYTCPANGSAANLLAVLKGGSSVTRATSHTTPVTIRVPTRILEKIEARAAAAHTSRSAYIIGRLSHDALDTNPAVAALSRLIAIHALVEQNKTVSAASLRELSDLVIQLSLAARREFDQ